MPFSVAAENSNASATLNFTMSSTPARRAFSFAQAGACLCLTIPADKDSLGSALGRSSVAMCAVTDIGFAEALVKKLAAKDEKFVPAAEALAVKAKRALERKREQARHEKNVRSGKTRTKKQ